MPDAIFEVEQKFRVADLSAVAARLEQLGAAPQGIVEQVDTYFAHPQRDFAQTDEALRLRRIGAANFITYKGAKLDATTKTRRELELPLHEGAAVAEKFGELLTLLGFRAVADVRKRRRTWLVPWTGKEIEVALDEVAGVGSFVELELSSPAEQVDTARGLLLELAARLELCDVERRSYLELLLLARAPSE